MTARNSKKDPMLVGYHFVYDRDKNPYDFITDPDTGLRPNQNREPSSFLNTDLTSGVEGATIPPLAIWKEGEWLSDMDKKEFESITHYQTFPHVRDEFDVWVCSGEGTPGNMRWRMYLLPDEISRTNLLAKNLPKHPMMWPGKLKKGTVTAVQSSSGWYSTQTGSPSRTAGKPTTTQSPSLPSGLRIRCAQCGHWFRADDLPGHIQCCPEVNGFPDWAIACMCCDSLDDTALVKDGYPRETKLGPTDATVGEVEENGAGAESPEWTPDFVADPEGSGTSV